MNIVLLIILRDYIPTGNIFKKQYITRTLAENPVRAETFATVSSDTSVHMLISIVYSPSVLRLTTYNLRVCQCTVCSLSLVHEQHRQNEFRQNHFFFMFFSNLRVKSSITKTISREYFFEGAYKYCHY